MKRNGIVVVMAFSFSGAPMASWILVSVSIRQYSESEGSDALKVG